MTPFRLNPAEIRVDHAPGFRGLENDALLQKHGVTLDFGRVKNKNKTAVADRGIQEFEEELLKVAPGTQHITSAELSSVIASLNQRIRFSGLSAREVLLQREQNTGQQLSFSDKVLSAKQRQNRLRNHLPSARSKAKCGNPAEHKNITVGTLVYIKAEKDKFNARPMYIVTALQESHATLQKFTKNQLSSRQYIVPLDHIFPITSQNGPSSCDPVVEPVRSSESDSEFELGCLPNSTERAEAENDTASSASASSVSSDVGDTEELSETEESENNADTPRSPRPQRHRRPPQWQADFDMSPGET